MLTFPPLLAGLDDVTTVAASGNGSWATLGPRVVGFVIAALVAVWLGVFVAEWSRRRQDHRHVFRQSSLFDQLCVTHDLDATMQQQLVQVANIHAHGDIVLPFVDPRILETASRTTPDLAVMGKKLFGEAWQPQ